MLAKIVIGLPGEFEYASFRGFDKKIMLVRDPRDNIVSRLLYAPCATAEIRNDKAKIAVVINALLAKEAQPRSVSVQDLFYLLRHLAGRKAAAPLSAVHDMALDFHRAHDDFLVYKYEDFIAGRYAAVEDYLPSVLRASVQSLRPSCAGRWYWDVAPLDVPAALGRKRPSC